MVFAILAAQVGLGGLDGFEYMFLFWRQSKTTDSLMLRNKLYHHLLPMPQSLH